MHNLLSYAQLNGWRHFDDTLNELSDENDKLDDYFECINVYNRQHVEPLIL